MKFVVVVPDGMCDWRYPQLGNRSPVEAVSTPGMDAIVKNGQVGLTQTMYDGLPMGSLVGFMGLLGYNPADYFPLGRAIFEGLARGVELAETDLAFRCNIVRVNGKHLLDFTAGQISDQDAYDFLDTVQLPESFEIYHDLSYRNVLVWHDAPLDDVRQLSLFEPHESIGEKLAAIMPLYQGKAFHPLIELMETSRHNGLMLWPWGATRPRDFPPVPFKLTMVTALSFLYGMGLAFGGDPVMPPGTTGYLGSDLGAKLDALIERFSTFDVGIIHCNAPDEEAHIKNIRGKMQSIEEIDCQVVKPLLDYLESQDEPYRVLLCPDHYTTTGDGRHHRNPVPYAVMGTGIEPNHNLTAYSEEAITICLENQQITPLESYRLLDTLREVKMDERS